MATISFDLDLDITYGASERVAPGLRRVVAKNPNRFTFRGTGTYIVGSGAGPLAIIDPGPDIDSHLDALMTAVGDATVSHVLVTHTHRDHSPLAGRLCAETGAITYGHGPHGEVPDPDPHDQIDFGPIPEDEATAAEANAAEDEDARQNEHADGGFDADFTPDVAVRHGDVIVGDGWSFECVHTPGHTSNHMCFAWREARALFSGDHVMGWSTSVISPPDGDMATYMHSLGLLLDRPDEVYWPTHGNPIRNPHEHVEAFISHRLGREEAIVAHLADGVRTVEQLVRSMYTQVHPKLYPAAARSVHAHLLHLVDTGRVTASSPLHRLTDEYRPA